MWVSVLKKRERLRIGMDFGLAQVFAQDGLRHETIFGSERVRFELSFRPGRVSARGRFWIGMGSVRLGPTGVYARDGFRSAMDFGPTRVSTRDRFCFGFFVSIWSVFSVSFGSVLNFFRCDRFFFRFHFGSISIFSVFVSFRFGSVFLFLFGLFILLHFGSI
ncbi:hypothetical protein HanRHA438_Chr13g0607801 [Helianthus annuus]|nr:hypothetical protein HanIR_Chr13g0649641 [Helianthus annuus]KAJ0859029.1 hypothetical protein HanRHA438_Chr13g0607801 [Helianthus annuus]